MEGGSRAEGRNPNQLRPFSCTGNPLHRAHGSARWAQGGTIVLAAVYGPKPGTRKGENPEKASIEVVWKPKTGQIGRQEREYETTLKRTLQSICLLTVHPNTTTSVVLQVVGDDGSLLPCAINASCAALAFAGIPMKHLAVAIGCGVMDNGAVILDTNTAEEQHMELAMYVHQTAASKILCSPGVSELTQVGGFKGPDTERRGVRARIDVLHHARSDV